VGLNLEGKIFIYEWRNLLAVIGRYFILVLTDTAINN